MAPDKSPQKREPLVTDETRHRRKRPQTSKSANRSDHKHQYEKVIEHGVLGWVWRKRCHICGRFDNNYRLYNKDFIRPECRNNAGISFADFYTVEELRVVYLGICVYEFGKDLEWHLLEEDL